RKAEKALAERGFVHVPSSAAPGGVIAQGDIRREATLHLAALRTLGASSDDRRQALQRYILGLALVAFSQQPATYLRQGCNLVAGPDRQREAVLVYADGRREPLALTGDAALAYAQATAAAFGVGENREVPFNQEAMKADVGGDEGEGAGRRGRKRGR